MKLKIDTVLSSSLTALALLAGFSPVHAATYYLSSSQGQDTNTGTSASAPWMSLNKIYQKCCSSSKFQPGDRILLKAGDAFEGLIQTYAAGTSLAPIYFGRYGTGDNPIIYGDNPSASWAPVKGHPGVYSTTPAFSSQVMVVADTSGNLYTRVMQGTNALDAWLAGFNASNWGITLVPNGLVYVRTPDGNPPPQMRLFESAGVLVGGPYTTVENLDIRRCYHGIFLDGYPGVIINNNSVQDSYLMGIYAGGATFNQVSSNTFTRSGWTAVLFAYGGNNWIHDNVVSGTSPTILGIPSNGRELCGIGLQQGTNNLVEHNTISNVVQSCFDFWLEANTTVRANYGFRTGSAAYPDGTGLRMYNNIFNLQGGVGFGGSHNYSPANSPAPDSGANLIFNNVIYGFTNLYGIYSDAGESSGMVFRNNIVMAASILPNLAQINSGIDIDYNLYYCTTTPHGWNWNARSYATFVAYQNASGQDAHSLYADPQFSSATPVGPADFQLQSSSPCLNAGQAPNSIGLLAPAVGVPIPQGAIANIGAY